MKCVLKQQDLPNVWSQIKQISVIFYSLKVVARGTKWVKKSIFNEAL